MFGSGPSNKDISEQEFRGTNSLKNNTLKLVAVEVTLFIITRRFQADVLDIYGADNTRQTTHFPEVFLRLSSVTSSSRTCIVASRPSCRLVVSASNRWMRSSFSSQATRAAILRMAPIMHFADPYGPRWPLVGSPHPEQVFQAPAE